MPSLMCSSYCIVSSTSRNIVSVIYKTPLSLLFTIFSYRVSGSDGKSEPPILNPNEVHNNVNPWRSRLGIVAQAVKIPYADHTRGGTKLGILLNMWVHYYGSRSNFHAHLGYASWIILLPIPLMNLRILTGLWRARPHQRFWVVGTWYDRSGHDLHAVCRNNDNVGVYDLTRHSGSPPVVFSIVRCSLDHGKYLFCH
jgi:hypothetical protein